MFNFLKSLFHRPLVTVKATNLTNKYLNNASSIAAATSSNLSIHKEISVPKTNTLYVLEFNGDKMATRSNHLAEEISSIIAIADPNKDSVLIRINSGGGAAHAYGYAASQIQRLKNIGVYVTVSVDKVAASGGYMMACVADKIIAAPYSIIGSIGVVAEFPNFSNLLKKLGVDYRQYTAGKFKRTVSMFGEVNEEGEDEFRKELEEMHVMFKEHVKSFRKDVDLEKVANGKTWTGEKAQEVGLVDRVMTSDEYIMGMVTQANVVKVEYIGERNGFGQMIGTGISMTLSDIFSKTINKVLESQDWKWK